VFTRSLHWSLSSARWIQSISSQSYLSKIHFNIVNPPTSWSSQWSLSVWLSYQYPIFIPLRSHSCYMPRPFNPPCLDQCNYTWRRAQVTKLITQIFIKFFFQLVHLILLVFTEMRTFFSYYKSIAKAINHPW
jgi:hypothetical protein